MDLPKEISTTFTELLREAECEITLENAKAFINDAAKATACADVAEEAHCLSGAAMILVVLAVDACKRKTA